MTDKEKLQFALKLMAEINSPCVCVKGPCPDCTAFNAMQEIVSGGFGLDAKESANA